jgi:asparagine synthase (glutamine-hydrolysing)
MEVDYHEVITIDEQELTTMRDDMKDRGPDGKGVWIAKNHDVGLAHCRLSLIDLPR